MSNFPVIDGVEIINANYVLGSNISSFTTGGVWFSDSIGAPAVDATNLFWDNTNNRLGIGTNTPTQPLSVSEKCCMTAIGGFAIKLTNQTGADSVQGQVVIADTASDDAAILTPTLSDEAFGVFLESGIADGSEAWVVISGIADVAMEDNTATTHGNWVTVSGVEAGYANATALAPVPARHWEETGHCIETVAAGGAGTHILARCVLHFN